MRVRGLLNRGVFAVALAWALIPDGAFGDDFWGVWGDSIWPLTPSRLHFVVYFAPRRQSLDDDD